MHILWNAIITSFHMNNRLWVTLDILWKQSQHIFSYDQQGVSDIRCSVKGSLITWPTVCEWHCTFVKSSLITSFSYDQQSVSDIAHLMKDSLITSFPMTNSLWVTLHILWRAVSSHLFPWPTGCKWCCTICERQHHHIFSCDQQDVSDMAHFVKGSLITSFLMPNRMWVTFHILWKAVSSHFSYGQQPVSDIAHFVKGSLITSFPMINSEWVTLHILWKAVLSHLFLWPTASEWHFTFCERQSHHLFSYDW